MLLKSTWVAEYFNVGVPKLGIFSDGMDLVLDSNLNENWHV